MVDVAKPRISYAVGIESSERQRERNTTARWSSGERRTNESMIPRRFNGTDAFDSEIQVRTVVEAKQCNEPARRRLRMLCFCFHRGQLLPPPERIDTNIEATT